MTCFPELKDDFTAENGVTYTWEDNRWRTKSFLTGWMVQLLRLTMLTPKNNPRHRCTNDGVGGWVPCSPWAIGWNCSSAAGRARWRAGESVTLRHHDWRAAGHSTRYFTSSLLNPKLNKHKVVQVTADWGQSR